MAFQTGTVSSITDLKTLIESFCTSNGWTLTSGWLVKGENYVALDVWRSDATAQFLRIRGATGVNTGICPNHHTIGIPTGDFPITYRMFLHTNPDQFVCTVAYGASFVQHIMFGRIIKVHESAYVGGNWVFGSSFDTSFGNTASASSSVLLNLYTSTVGLSQMYRRTDQNFGYSAQPAAHYDSGRPRIYPFATVQYGRQHTNSLLDTVLTQVHAKIDGQTWLGKYNATYATVTATVSLSQDSTLLLVSSLSAWNSQAVLVPVNVSYYVLVNSIKYEIPLGTLGHIRYLRVDNYNIGDIIAIGPDRWMVFPFFKKNTSLPLGGDTYDGHSGCLGMAIKYDGP